MHKNDSQNNPINFKHKEHPPSTPSSIPGRPINLLTGLQSAGLDATVHDQFIREPSQQLSRVRLGDGGCGYCCQAAYCELD